MPNDVKWITPQITKARKKHNSVTNAVSVRIEELICGELSEQPLSIVKLTSIAKLLLADMLPAASDTEAKE